jgi:hypothetical protein
VSEDTTQDMSQKYDTKPTIETVLERINALSDELRGEIQSFRAETGERLSLIEERVIRIETRMEIRLDRIEGEVKLTHSELYSLRADFKEFRPHSKEPA